MYYPEFEENKTKPEIRNQFSLEVTQLGEIVHLTPSKDNKSSKIELSEIGSSYLDTYTISYADNLVDSLGISLLSKILMVPDFESNKILRAVEYRVPLTIKEPDLQLVLTDASFPLISNSIIQRKVKDQTDQEVKISMIGENSDYYFPAKRFMTKKRWII